MNLEIIEKIGLSKAEIKVYIALLELGSVPSGKIVKETNFRKSTVYESIRRLQSKGLVYYIIKKGMKHFEAAPPDKIIDFVGEQQRELKETEAEARKLVTELGGNLGGAGSVSWQFKEVGLITIRTAIKQESQKHGQEAKIEEKNPEEVTLELMDIEGVLDIDEVEIEDPENEQVKYKGLEIRTERTK